jgi:predicted DNA-binding protein
MKKTVTIRLPEDMHEQLKKMADEEKRTISSLIELLLIKGLEVRK